MAHVTELTPSEAERRSGGRSAGDGALDAHPNLKDVAERHISEGIVSGRMRPGEKVDQDEIAAVLGISRLPVREALIGLAQKGFVTAVPRRGAFVATLGADDVEDHYEVLAMAFALAARRAATRLSPERLARLAALEASIDDAGDRQRVDALNGEFYSIISNGGSSARLQSILVFLGGALPAWHYLASPACLEIEARYRSKMLEALEARDPDAAAAVTVEHLRDCASAAVEALIARGYWAKSDESAAEPEAAS